MDTLRSFNMASCTKGMQITTFSGPASSMPMSRDAGCQVPRSEHVYVPCMPADANHTLVDRRQPVGCDNTPAAAQAGSVVAAVAGVAMAAAIAVARSSLAYFTGVNTAAIVHTNAALVRDTLTAQVDMKSTTSPKPVATSWEMRNVMLACIKGSRVGRTHE